MLTEPLKIKLTIAQRNIINIKQQDKLNSEQILNDVTAAIIAGTIDPTTLGDCSTVIKGEEIIITPNPT